jgi:large subunit ribosomal protein L9
MKTKLILRVDMPELGHTGEVVEVASGYARNFLVPRGLAYTYTEDAKRRIEKAKIEAEVHRAEVRTDMVALAARLASVQLTFEENANAGGHLYGAVTAKRIAEALGEHQLDIPENHVRLADPIRNTGEYTVAVHVHADIDAEVQIWVVSTTPAPAPVAVEAPAATEESEEATS